MKKIINSIILSLILFLTLGINCKAANSSITASATGTTYNYISGLGINYNTASGYNLYVLNNGTTYGYNTTLYNPVEANSAFTYIINNSNVTSNTYANYYIAQAAILWYQDYLSGNDNNISSSVKTYIINNQNTDTYAKYIYKLFTNAKSFSTNGASIKFNKEAITFTKSGNYYVSNYIYVTTYNLNSTPSIRFYGAPSSTTSINNTVTNNGTGSFQIRIPVSSLTYNNINDFEVYITGSGYNYSAYRYSSNLGGDDAIYGRVYSESSNNIEASMPVSIEGTGNTNIRISTMDGNGNYISGITYSIYSGDCSNSTCYSDNLVKTFTSTTSYTTLSNTLSTGEYTVVRTSNNSSYTIPYKKLINVENTTNIQSFIIYSTNNYNTNYDDNTNFYGNEFNVKIYNDLNSSTNYLRIYNESDNIVSSFKSSSNPYTISLASGIYYIKDSNNKINKTYFKISSTGLLYIKKGSVYERTNIIDLTENQLYDHEVIIDDPIYNDEIISNDGMDVSNDIEITNEVETETSVIETLINCPITSVSSTIKYITGAIILSIGGYLVFKNVKKQKNSI